MTDDSLSAVIVRAKSGVPPTCCKFLSLIPFEPPRAGIIAITPFMSGLLIPAFIRPVLTKRELNLSFVETA